jgi:GxxExxY protein
MINLTEYKKIVYDIIGAAMEVHHVLGWGLQEHIYQEALQLELLERGINSEREKGVCCFYKQHQLEQYYKLDLLVGDIVVELKSTNGLNSAHRSQLFNYLRLTKMPVGLLINFGMESLQGERYAYIEDTNECVLLNRNMSPVL